jgi:hypothetical protein
MTLRVEIQLGGRLPQTLAEVIGTRFGDVALGQQRKATVLVAHLSDQSALRALLCLIWDIGGNVMSVTVHNQQPSPSPLTLDARRQHSG